MAWLPTGRGSQPTPDPNGAERGRPRRPHHDDGDDEV